MPDIQTAMKQALTRTLAEWDDDDEGTNVPVPSAKQPVSASVSQPSQNIQGIPMTKVFNVTNNVSRATFNYIKDNPGSTRKEVIKALSHQGYGEGSVSSLIAQMVRNKLIHVTNDLYYADATEYRPLKSLKAIKKLEAATEPKPKRKYERKAVTGIGALLREKLEAMPNPSQDALDAAAYAMGGQPVVSKRITTIIRSQTPDDIIQNLTVFQARELYDRLKQIFNA